MTNVTNLSIVLPAKAGIQRLSCERHWIPAFAGTTEAIRRTKRDASISPIVIPAKAGIQRLSCERHWGARERARAFAGTTEAK